MFMFWQIIIVVVIWIRVGIAMKNTWNFRSAVAQWWSAWIEIEGLRGLSLTEQDMIYPLISTGSTQEDPSRHYWNIVDRNIKNQNKFLKLWKSFESSLKIKSAMKILENVAGRPWKRSWISSIVQYYYNSKKIFSHFSCSKGSFFIQIILFD